MPHSFKAAIAAVIIILSFVVQVAAGQFEDASAAYKRGDYATALWLFRTLATQGNAVAQYNLGVLYEAGRDYSDAVRWYRLAAQQGYAKAQSNLGGMFAKGRGVPQDYANAVRWYRRAADRGNAVAQYNLGIMYGNGRGVPRDYVDAYMWLNLAAAQGNQDATTAIDPAENRNWVAQRMTPAQIAEAQRLAREWKPK